MRIRGLCNYESTACICGVFKAFLVNQVLKPVASSGIKSITLVTDVKIQSNSFRATEVKLLD
jgi:hypothetical protein